MRAGPTASITPNPSVSGSWTSRNTTSGAASTIARTAAAPRRALGERDAGLGLEAATEPEARERLVVDDKDVQRGHRGASVRNGSSTRTRLPLPGVLASVEQVIAAVQRGQPRARVDEPDRPPLRVPVARRCPARRRRPRARAARPRGWRGGSPAPARPARRCRGGSRSRRAAGAAASARAHRARRRRRRRRRRAGPGTGSARSTGSTA